MKEDINPNIQFTKVRNVKSPNRAHATDAGTDFFIPNYSQQFLEDLIIKNAGNNLHYNPVMEDVCDLEGNKIGQKSKDLEIIIPAGEQINVPSGIRVNIVDKRTYLRATNKSGVASKYHLGVKANTIDAPYQGEMHLNLSNDGNVPVTVKTGMKLVQMVHQEYINTQWEEISNEDYIKIGKSDRASGGFSSTGLY